MNTITTMPSVKPGKPAPRYIRVTHGPLQPAGGIYVEIKAGREVADYRVSPQPSDFGDAFLVEKLDGILIIATYHVNLSNEGDLCDCAGGCYAEKCKHIDGLIALRRAGKI